MSVCKVTGFFTALFAIFFIIGMSFRFYIMNFISIVHLYNGKNILFVYFFSKKVAFC